MKKIQKFLLTCADAFLFNCICIGQGFVGNSGTNSLYPVNSGLSLTPLNVGIGTDAPSEQLHTTEGVRFEGLTNDDKMKRIVVQDETGKLFWRDAGSINPPANDNFWSLTGNAGTVPVTNYLGTSDNTRLVLSTNAVEKMTIYQMEM